MIRSFSTDQEVPGSNSLSATGFFSSEMYGLGVSVFHCPLSILPVCPMLFSEGVPAGRSQALTTVPTCHLNITCNLFIY